MRTHYAKKIIESSIGATFMPVGVSAVKGAGMGALGDAASTSMIGGFTLSTAKRHLKGGK